MRSKTTSWFETKIRYDKTMEDGRNKKVTEVYTVEALSFTEAESVITEEMSHYISGEFDVKAITRAPYGEIFFSDADSDDKWYRAKLAFITIDEKTEKEKRSNVVYLVQAASLDNARQYVNEVMDKTVIDYEVVSISETPIMDVFEKTK
jgi:putative phage tail component, N-terminal domain protein